MGFLHFLYNVADLALLLAIKTNLGVDTRGRSRVDTTGRALSPAIADQHGLRLTLPPRPRSIVLPRGSATTAALRRGFADTPGAPAPHGADTLPIAGSHKLELF
jgi:hypothetical protein